MWQGGAWASNKDMFASKETLVWRTVGQPHERAPLRGFGPHRRLAFSAQFSSKCDRSILPHERGIRIGGSLFESLSVQPESALSPSSPFRVV